MGQLNIPQSGLVYLDTDAIIYSVEKISPYWDLLQPLWLATQTGQISVISSELALLETLVKPIRTGDKILETSFRDLLLHTREVKLLAIQRIILEQAIDFRARFNLKTPDAIHAATALMTGCPLFVSNDSIFKRIPGLPVTILDELI